MRRLALGFSDFDADDLVAGRGARVRRRIARRDALDDVYAVGNLSEYGVTVDGRVKLLDFGIARITADGIWRYAKPANPRQYIDNFESKTHTTDLQAVSAQERLFEFMLNALRLTSGFDEQLFVARTGLEVEYLRTKLAGLVDKGLIVQVGATFWQATPLGRRFLNDLQAEFLPE